MKGYLTVSVWLVIFLAVFYTGCESTDSANLGPEAVVQGPILQKEPKIEVYPEPPAETEPGVAEPAAPAEPAAHAETEPRADELETPAEAAPDSVAVTVNGVDITEGDIEAKIKPQLERMAAQASQMPPQLVEQYKKQLRQQALEAMIVELLLDEKVKAENIVVTEDDVIDHLKKSGSQQQPPLSLEDIKALIEARGQNFDDAKRRIKKALAYQKIIEAQWAGEINITEDDARKYYSENKKRFEMPEQVRASHILIKPDTTDPNTDPNDAKAKAREKAEDLLKQIRDGADFATLARENSSCPSAAKGGDLGLGQKGDISSGQRSTWVAPFEKAAFELKVGQVSDVVETRFGYHIIRLTARQAASVIAFEQARDDIINMLTQRRQGELAKEYIESLKADANIVYSPGKEPPSVTSLP